MENTLITQVHLFHLEWDQDRDHSEFFRGLSEKAWERKDEVEKRFTFTQ